MEVQKTEGGPKVENIIETVRQNSNGWLDALLTKEPERVAAQYTEDCTFLPTFSSKLLHGREETKGYFEHFLHQNPKCSITEEAIDPKTSDNYLVTGMYTFEVDQEGGRGLVQARFTYDWKRDADGQWRIKHHHSSELPKPKEH